MSLLSLVFVDISRTRMEALLVATVKVNHYDKDVAWENKRKENFQRCKNARDELVKEKRKVPHDLDHTGGMKC